MSSSYEAVGRIHEIFDEQQVSEKFRKREFVLEVVDGQYPEHIKFQLSQDKTSLVDTFKIGDEAKVSFNLRGRGFNKNGQMLYFTNLEAWRIEKTAAGAQQPAARAGGQAQASTATQRASAVPVGSNDDNDLPF
ncbi:DUF3127 domain-containing protein [Hymenobacter sp. NST-14]|uniref:DUF3127 domain-containing protein n=1 Tax=Hymenobacter piscis TaxID=2839984 RepID=UPI001C034533|nr:DUF3127 domain-containing protein [Hymenobacter piscis]MBT9394387.1 DUF3127 domain-containing protein [Hymenobacter piscis]